MFITVLFTVSLLLVKKGWLYVAFAPEFAELIKKAVEESNGAYTSQIEFVRDCVRKQLKILVRNPDLYSDRAASLMMN